MSQNAGSTQRIATDAAIPDSADHAIRPKVLRRPHHFSSAPSLESPTELPVEPVAKILVPAPDLAATLPVPVSSAVPAPSWQDDARFGVALVIIVLLTNIALMLWLPNLRARPSAPLATTAIDAPPADRTAADIILYTVHPLADLPPEEKPAPESESETTPAHMLGTNAPAP